MRSIALLSISISLAACGGQESDIARTESQNFCPAIPPPLTNIRVTAASPFVLDAGSVVTIEGTDFYNLPVGTQAWFYSDSNGWTATTPLVVDGPKTARAIVPSHHLMEGPGQVSLYYTTCADCTSQGGGPNDCVGTWVNASMPFPRVELTHPRP